MVAFAFVMWIYVREYEKQLASFLNHEMAHDIHILSHRKQEPDYTTKSIAWLMMPWRRNGPAHQLPRYWPNSHGIIPVSPTEV